MDEKKAGDDAVPHATAMAASGQSREAFELLHEIERKFPHFSHVYSALAVLCLQEELPSHTIYYAKRAIADPDLEDETRSLMNDMIREITATIQRNAAKHMLSFETMQNAYQANEKAILAVNEYHYAEAEARAKEAIQIAPNWSPPRNNLAQALYFSGRTEEGIATLKDVIGKDPENIFALTKLVVYYYGINQVEQAREYARRLVQLSIQLEDDSPEMDDVISSVALVEDTPVLYNIARRYLNAPFEALSGRSWYCLAVAALRSGKPKDAKKLLEKIDRDHTVPAMENLLNAMEENPGEQNFGLKWVPIPYPITDLFLTMELLDEWEKVIANLHSPVTPAEQRKIDQFFHKYPFTLSAIKQMLWEEDTFSTAIDLFISMERAELDEEMLRFVFSQTGLLEARATVLVTLAQHGRYNGSKRVKLWNEKLEEWREVEISTQKIDDTPVNMQPKTLQMVERAHHARSIQEAIALLRKAVEMEPTSPIPLFNLGVTLIKEGKTEEGQAIIYRSIEVDPNYTYGHASIALFEAENGDLESASRHLEIVNQAEIINPDTAVIANLAGFLVAQRRGDWETARQRMMIATQLAPDHPLIQQYQKLLELGGVFETIDQKEKESARRIYDKVSKMTLTRDMILADCLNVYSRDLLAVSADLHDLSIRGNKNALISRLSEMMLDEAAMEDVLMKSWFIEDKERDALAWLLEQGGICPWADFSQQYGNDREDMIQWKYTDVDPSTVTGWLRMTGLLFSGTLEGEQVAFIPADLRLILKKLL